MINRIGISPSFQSYVNICRKDMTDEQLKAVDSDLFQNNVEDLRKNRNPDVVKIYPSKEEGEEGILRMDIANFYSDTKLQVSVVHEKLAKDDPATDMANKYFLHSFGYLKPDENGNFKDGATFEITNKPLISFMQNDDN